MNHQLEEYEANKDGFGPKTNTALSIERYKTKEKGWWCGNKEAKGNGIAMKSSPFGLYLEYISSTRSGEILDISQNDLGKNILNISFVSHANNLSFASGMVQAQAVKCCLENKVSIFDLMCNLVGMALICESTEDHTLSNRLCDVRRFATWFRNGPPEDIFLTGEGFNFGKGGYYIPDSLPFTYMFFLRNPCSIESLFDLVSAGGDTDTNGSMCGALLGATNGMKLFERHEDLIEGLWRKDEIIDAVNAFCDKFEIK
jgi:ADP-ribosylglycohydrolase